MIRNEGEFFRARLAKGETDGGEKRYLLKKSQFTKTWYNYPMNAKIRIFILVVAILGLCGYLFFHISPQKTSNIPRSLLPSSFHTSIQNPKAMETVSTGLRVPWALAFLLNDEILITERSGSVKMLSKNNILEIGEIDVHQNGESGLHGVAVHPNFNKNHFVYFYHTYSSIGEQSQNKVVRYTLEKGKIGSPTIIVDKIPGAIFHDGGRIKFGPDGYLYITTGDAQNPSLAQDKNSLAGKILRTTDEGKSAPGNPFNNLVYSYGHRNPQGIAWDKSGNLWETEHGSTATDEVNKIEAGKNYGWPDIRGNEKRDGMVSPVIQSGGVTWAPAGATFYNNSLFFGGLRGQALFELNTTTLELKEHFKGELGRIREVVLGLDNMLYITTSNRDGRGNPGANDDKIIRVNPKQLD